MGLLLALIGRIVSTKRVAQKLEPKVPAIAFGVNPRKFAESHEKKHKKIAYRWVSFENTLTPGVVRWANHPQSYWQSKNNNRTLDWDSATAMDGSITDFFQETFGPDPIYELAAKCNIFRGCIGAQTKEEADLVREQRAADFIERMFSWKVCSELEGTGKTEEEWNALPLKERMKLGAGRCRSDEARAKAANICLDDWMKLSNEQKNYADVARLYTWKVCGELEGTGKTEEEWNAMSIKERMKLGVARTLTWKACGHLVGEGMTEED
jgi:hypothetical protein